MTTTGMITTGMTTTTGITDAAPRAVEPMTGIEPAYSAWEADVLPLNYIGRFDHEG